VDALLSLHTNLIFKATVIYFILKENALLHAVIMKTLIHEADTKITVLRQEIT
jgi:hypothetical protein